jgi:cell division protein FtsB
MSDRRDPRARQSQRPTRHVYAHRPVPALRAERPARPLADEPAPASSVRRHRSQVHATPLRRAKPERSGALRLGIGRAATQKAPKPTSRIERRRAISRRRARTVTVACVAFCALVLATSFPVSALLRQHQQISSATGELHALTAANSSLEQEASELSQPANVAALARRDYDLVRPGQKAYTVLPLPGSSQSSAASSGHSSLDQGPVAPGSEQSQALLGGDGLNGSSPPGDTSGSGGDLGAAGSKTQAGNSPSSPPGLWGRVLDTLEFWR